MRRRWVLPLVAALAVAGIAEGSVRALDDEMAEPQEWSWYGLQVKARQIDRLADRGGASVLLIGSSIVGAGVDPRLVGGLPDDPRPAYNAGIIGGSVRMMTTFVDEVALPALRPSVAVVVVSSREVNPNDPGQINGNAGFYRSAPVRELLGTETLVERAERVAKRWSALVRYRAVLRRPARLFDRQTVPGDDSLGFLIDDRAHPFGLIVPTDDPVVRQARGARLPLPGKPLTDWRIGAAYLDDLRTLLAHLERAGVRTVLVTAPTTRRWVDLHPHGAADYERYLRAVGGVARDAGVPFVDPGLWPAALYMDPSHVNAAGIERFSALARDAARQVRDG